MQSGWAGGLLGLASHFGILIVAAEAKVLSHPLTRHFRLRPLNATPVQPQPMLSVHWRSFGSTTHWVSSKNHPLSPRPVEVLIEGWPS